MRLRAIGMVWCLVVSACAATSSSAICDPAKCAGCCSGNACVLFASQTNELCGSTAECTSCASDLSCQQGLCTPANTCATNNGDCDAHATCSPPPAAVKCACTTGFVGDGQHCAPVVSTLRASPGVLSPAFRPDLTTYLVIVPPDTTTVQLAASSVTPGATMAFNGTGNPMVTLAPTGVTTVTVTALVGTTRSVPYQVQVHRSTTSLAERAFVKASNTHADLRFGRSIALSADGLVLAVGASGDSSNATGINGSTTDTSAPRSGAVAIYRRASNTGAWSQEAFVKSSNTETADAFGWAVALSSDGSTLAVSAPGEDGPTNGATDSGAVYVFRHGTSWAQEALLRSSNAETGDGFGWGLALSADGATLVASAPFEDGAGNALESSGAAFVFTRAGTAWSEQALLRAMTPARNLLFGRAVAISADALTIAVASPTEALGGVVTLFKGPARVPDGQVRGANTLEDDHFGASLALSGDGLLLAVGAPTESTLAVGVNPAATTVTASASGAVYLLRRGASGWAQEAFVKATNTHDGDVFGTSVALSADGAVLAVGAPGEDSESRGIEGNQSTLLAADSGAVFLYRGQGGVWVRSAYVKASNADAADVFGTSVALSSNGARLVATSPGDDSSANGLDGDAANNDAAESGACFVFDE